MAKHFYGHFDSTPEDVREILAEDWARYMRAMVTSGVRNGGSNLHITENVGMKIGMDTGIANIQGYVFESYEEGNERYTFINVDAAHPSLPRIDRVVLRLDRTIAVRKIQPVMLLGTAGANPTPPALTRNDNIWEISLAQIQMPAGCVAITASQIKDERLDESVCGLMNSVLGLDSSVWQAQFDAFMAGLKALRDAEAGAVQERIKELQAIIDGQVRDWNTQFLGWFTSVQGNLPTYAGFDFDNVSLYPNTKTSIHRNTDGSINETMINKSTGKTLGERLGKRNPDGSCNDHYKVYNAAGALLWERDVKTVREANNDLTIDVSK